MRRGAGEGGREEERGVSVPRRAGGCRGELGSGEERRGEGREERGAIVIGVSRVVAVLELALARPVQVKPKVGRRDRRRCERLPAGTTVGYCVLFSDVISLLFFLFRLSIFNFFFFFLMYEDLQDYKIHNKLAIAQVCYKTKNSKFRTTKQEVLEHLQQ